MGIDGAAWAAVGAAEFAEAMIRLGPFEPAPRVAVAVSGGGDSMALALLADHWARERGGTVTALTVDHRLRPEAAREAAQTGRWLAARGIAHYSIAWEEARPCRGIQAAARAARYRLLEGWCATAGVFHLLTAHHREDQAETLLLRLARGSGLDGLAGMVAVGERRACRVLRPLLAVPRARLRATLEAAGQEWIEDPSNHDGAYARVRLRQIAPLLAAEGLRVERLVATAGHLARARVTLEAAIAALLGTAVMIHPAGFARLDPAPLMAAPQEIGLRALAAVLATIGGGEFPPRFDRLERLYRGICGERLEGGRTLGGCRIVPRRGALLVCREPAAAAPPVPAPAGMAVTWDGRFRLALPARAPAGLTVGALGGAGAALGAVRSDLAELPTVVRASLPAFRDRKGVAAVPHLGHVRDDCIRDMVVPLDLVFRPTRPLASAGFTVV